MKKLSLFLFVLFSVSTLGFEKSKGNGFVIWDGKKSDQIKFYLDLEINSKSPNKAIALIEEMVFFIKDLEPNTITYEYYISEDNKSISLREVYKNSEAALTHMNNFEAGPYAEKFLELMRINSFQVMGNASDDLMESVKAFTDDNRVLISGFDRN
jgi:quinol monooxygenase YgiN|tara:strand:+ start:374 stop:838 length:465 start_codon:yes stop_codon:yes gene_type:complete